MTAAHPATYTATGHLYRKYKNGTYMVRVSILTPGDMFEAMKAYAVEQDKSLSAVGRAAVREYLKKRGKL